ncbi:MAG: LON peptidase substrate-binding domain-containing protein, partial [Acidimicrobiia bacterium]
MPETAQLTLPVLPLHNGVVFPHMAVTIQVSSEEGRIAIEASRRAGGKTLIVPRLHGRYAAVGTIATVQSDDDGNVVVSGESRARVGAGSVDEAGALWVEAEESPEVDLIDDALDELVGEYRAVVAAVLENRGLGRVSERLLAMENPSQLADLAVYSPDL